MQRGTKDIKDKARSKSWIPLPYPTKRPQPFSFGFTQISKLSHLSVGRPCSSVFLKYYLFLSSPGISSRHLNSSLPLLGDCSAISRLGLHGNHMETLKAQFFFLYLPPPTPFVLSCIPNQSGLLFSRLRP